MFAVVLIYQFTQIWNDLLFTLVIVSTESSPAAPVVLILAGLGELAGGTRLRARMAGAFFAALPTLAVYILFGEEFAEGWRRDPHADPVQRRDPSETRASGMRRGATRKRPHDTDHNTQIWQRLNSTR